MSRVNPFSLEVLLGRDETDRQLAATRMPLRPFPICREATGDRKWPAVRARGPQIPEAQDMRAL
jgi:hypothetical protein